MGEFLRTTPLSRSQRKAINNEGVKFLGSAQQDKVEKWRSHDLEVFDAYYEARQYEGMKSWDQREDSGGDYIPIRERKPRIVYNFGKVLVDRVAAKLVGDNVFPKLRVEDSPDDDTFVSFIIKAGKLRVHLMDVAKKMLVAGSGFLRFYIVDGAMKVEVYKSKYCYPEFQPSGDLESIRVQFLYEDSQDKDKDGNPKVKWYKLELGMTSDKLYNNPEYERGKEPTFSVVSSVEHNMGFVQGQWFKTMGDDHNSPDGYSVICDILELIDEINYSLSQSSQAVQYNQEPLMTLKGMSEDEVSRIVRSSQKALDLGREGEASFLESSMEGVKTATEHRDKVKMLVQDIARVVFLDPEKMAANAQSGKAMEVMHGPMIELINELRPQIEDQITSLVLKMGIVMLHLNSQGIPVPVQIPPGYQPDSLNITIHWPPVFSLTIEDLQKKAQMATQLAGASIFSRETLTRWLAPDFDIENIDEEIQKIASQPILNPFGGGFGG